MLVTCCIAGLVGPALTIGVKRATQQQAAVAERAAAAVIATTSGVGVAEGDGKPEAQQRRREAESWAFALNYCAVVLVSCNHVTTGYCIVTLAVLLSRLHAVQNV